MTLLLLAVRGGGATVDDLVSLLQIWGVLAVVGLVLVSTVLVTAMRLGWADFQRFDDEVDETPTD